MEKEKTTKIHEFDPVIYPFRLWVAINPTLEEIRNKFYALNNDMELVDITEQVFKYDRFSVSTCYPVTDKESKWIGILCGIYKPKNMTTGVIAHEASHITDFLCERLGIQGFDFDGGEARAYIVQWAADCIEKVKNNKIK